jgi:hypothetical protein
MNMNSFGTIRKNNVVESHTTRKQYAIVGVRLYGVELAPESKAYATFLQLTPRCVSITEKRGEGVVVEVP